MNTCKRPVEYVAHCDMFTTGRRAAEPGTPIPFIGNCTLERFEKTQRR